jgi:hypothetical protein
MGRLFNDDSVLRKKQIVTLVEEAMHQSTKIWGDDAIYEKALALNVQVFLKGLQHTPHFLHLFDLNPPSPPTTFPKFVVSPNLLIEFEGPYTTSACAAVI